MNIVDQIYQCQMPGQVFGIWQLQCHLQIFQSRAGIQTVIITDMGFEMGWFIPYVVENLIDQIVREFNLNPTQVVWIEHYTPGFRKPSCADFNQVTFEWNNGQAKHPTWHALAPETLQALICEDLQPALARGT
jgi:hypothetical protein